MRSHCRPAYQADIEGVSEEILQEPKKHLPGTEAFADPDGYVWALVN
jgi:hypothetical protein